jgi:hypothetical protein
MLPNIAISGPAEDQVRGQLGSVASTLISRGQEIAYSPTIGSLRKSSTANITYSLRSSTAYTFVAACDNDCSDIDVWLYDGQGNEISRDVEPDSMPIVFAQPRYNDTFTLKVKMYNCTIEPCFYGIIVGRE